MNFGLVRFLANGGADTTFSGDGKLELDFAGGDDYGNAVRLQADGKIVVAGQAFVPNRSYDFAVARFDSSGNLDTAFGTGGKVTVDFRGGQFDAGWGLAIQSDGPLVVGGYSAAAGSADFALARLTPGGKVDTPQVTDYIWNAEYIDSLAVRLRTATATATWPTTAKRSCRCRTRTIM